MTFSSTNEYLGKRRIEMPVTSLGMVFLLAPMLLTFVIVQLASMRSKIGVVSETTLTVLRCTSILAAVLALCYFCEHHFPFPHADKFESSMMYWMSFAILILVSLFTVRRSRSDDFMHREQTEEWKGWMQFLFLAYHYWKMEGAYNDIRVYITCYLWMTGFGNFSFFYMKEDFSLSRVLQMMWRMNFFCVCLCLALNNPYIVYYICPLHTFYFLFTYATMFVWSRVNRSQYGAVTKVIVAATLIYLVYDLVPSTFEVFFWWLNTQPTGASIGSHGVRWEWYFRSFLDHFSTIWGMVFALNMPFVIEWFKQVESFTPAREWGIKLVVLVGLFAAASVWSAHVNVRKKNEYNALHCYYAVIPLLAYLFLRNMCSALRSRYLHLLHLFGQITLESYLLQYHIWLSANAGKLLNIIPGCPIATYCLATVIHIFCANQIFNVTTKLRDIVLPTDINLALRNLALMAAALLASSIGAWLFLTWGLTMTHVITAVILLTILYSTILLSPGKQQPQKAFFGSDRSVPLFVVLLVVSAVSLNFVPRVVAPTMELAPTSILEGSASVDDLDAFYFSLQSLTKYVRPAFALSGSRASTSVLQMGRAALDSFELHDSQSAGKLFGFRIGSMAQPAHGFVAVLLIAACAILNDPFFGLARLGLAVMGPAGKRTISWDQAYSPLLAKFDRGTSWQPPQDAESQIGEHVGERTPLVRAIN